MKLIRIVILIIVMMLIFFLITIKKYKEFQYYRSEEMNIISSSMVEFIRGYQRNYCKYPPDGDIFIEYLENNNEFLNTVGYEIPEILKNKGLGILKDSINEKIILFVRSSNHKRFNYITDVSFIDYIKGSTNIIISEDELFDICNWQGNLNVKLFSKGHILKNKLVEKEIYKKIKLFRIRNTDIKKPIKPLSCNILYFHAKLKGELLEFDLICDPFKGKKDTKSLIDSLNYLLNDIAIKNKIDELYVPLKLCHEE